MTTFTLRTLSFLTLIILGSVASAQESEDVFLYFEFGKYNLTQDSRNKLDVLASHYTIDDSLQVEIFGNADSVGSDVFNIELAQNRCHETWDYLDAKENLYIKKAAMSTSGEHFPILANKTSFNRGFNRRVLVSVRKLTFGEAPYPLVINGKREGNEGYVFPSKVTDIAPLPPATTTPATEEKPAVVAANTENKEIMKAKDVIDPVEEERQKQYQNTLIKARKMLRKGMSIADVMEFTDLDKATVEKLKESIGVLQDD